MGTVLLKSGIMVFIILLGFTLKCLGIFRQSDSKIFTKVMLYVTLPALLVNAMRDFTMDASMLLFIFLGFLANCILVALGWRLGAKESPKVRAMYMLMMAGFNIGSFATAFVSNVFPAMLLQVIMFDVGNTVMTCGGSYSFAVMQLQPEAKFNLKALLKNMFTTFVFDLYLGLFVMSLFGIRFPAPVYELTTTIAGANTVVVMLMLGILFEVKLTKEARHQVATIVGARVVCVMVMAVIMLLVLPLPFDEKRIAAMMVCTPIGSMGPVFCAKLDCDPNVYGTATSLTIPTSIVLMMVLSLL